MEINSTKNLTYTKRWFAYFDLLGFSSLVRQNEIKKILPIYESVLAVIEEKGDLHKNKGISYSWFSDTFILFTRRGDIDEFPLIEQAARLFFQKLVLNKIAVRGALSYGDLYTQQAENVFLGEALINAYEYGEKQNWINFILTPSSYLALKKFDVDPKSLAYYRLIEDENIITHSQNENVFAYAFNNMVIGKDNRNPFLETLVAMRDSSEEIFKVKYNNSIDFAKKHEWIRPY